MASPPIPDPATVSGAHLDGSVTVSKGSTVLRQFPGATRYADASITLY